MTARLPSTELAYQTAIKNGDVEPLHMVPAIKQWRYWKLIKNRFPHDKLNTRHNMIVLLRECSLWDIAPAELLELWLIFAEMDAEYDYIKINLKSLRSVHGIPHIHIADYKDEYK